MLKCGAYVISLLGFWDVTVWKVNFYNDLQYYPKMNKELFFKEN